MVIGDALRRCALNYPNKIAVRDYYGVHYSQGFSYTYEELFETVNRLANGFVSLGLQKGDRVAVQTGTGMGYVLSLLALAKAGMIIAPVSRAFMREEIIYQIEDSGAKAFIVDADIFDEKVGKIKAELKSVNVFIGIGKDSPCDYRFNSLIKEGSPDEPGIKVQDDDVATGTVSGRGDEKSDPGCDLRRLHRLAARHGGDREDRQRQPCDASNDPGDRHGC